MLLDCGSHKTEDTRNCRIYVTLVIIFTFTLFLFKLGTLFFLCYYWHLLCHFRVNCNLMFVPYQLSNMGSDEGDVLLKLSMKQKYAVLGKSAPCVQQNDVSEEIKYKICRRIQVSSTLNV